ncbi:hypothetical protein [Cellulosilyticum ruminicola]|uniref:hypothetical protein n=1 Tax=Cellulosilyticum ruminicola TaxID=425254 RepID=UPI0006D12324|nr:hypothetical protein [Cellulosilyticum ruminicola]
MNNAACISNSIFCELNDLEMLMIDGGANIADYAAAVGGVYSAAVSVGAMGWVGATAAAVCTAPVVAGSAAVVGVLCAGYGVYCLFK